MNLRDKLKFWIMLSNYVDMIVRGTSPLSLPDAIADSLSYVKAFGGTEQRNIPQPYTQVNYVTNTAQTAVDTGIMIDFSKNYEFEVECRAVSGSWYILQSRASSTGNITGIHGATSGSTITLVVGNVTVCTSAITRTVGNKLYVKATLNAGTATLYVKDETANTEDTQTGSYGTSQPNPTASVYLLGNAGGQYVDVNSDIYMARIKENDTVVMDYVPARQGATAGFYDTVSGTFKTAETPANLSADGNTVPTPDAPMDIVSNNGVLKWDSVNQRVYTDGTVETINVRGKNLFDAQNVEIAESTAILPNGSLVANQGVNTCTSYIKVSPNATYTISGDKLGTPFGSSVYYFGLATYDVNKQFLGRSTDSGTVTDKYTFTTGANVEYIRFQYVKIGNIDTFQLEKGSTATAYEPYYNGGTATAEMLLKVGTYEDVQSIIDGVVTRNVGVKVFDGTEDGWTKTNSSFANSSLFADKKTEKSTLFCSHFQYDSGSTSAIPDDCIGCASTTTNTYFRNDALSTVEDWTQWLADQYANGTPVIVIYPLATPTTESVTGQTMQVTDGDNILEITQASLNNLELEAKYKKQA